MHPNHQGQSIRVNKPRGGIPSIGVFSTGIVRAENLLACGVTGGNVVRFGYVPGVVLVAFDVVKYSVAGINVLTVFEERHLLE